MQHGNPTHKLSCKHVVGKSINHYEMECILVSVTKKGKAKVIVFGDRFWRNKNHLSRTRYVDLRRLKPFTET